MNTPDQRLDITLDLRQEMMALWQRSRSRCAWFVREDFEPSTREEFSMCMDMLMRHGDHDTCVMEAKA
ncbi:MAG: hypothetical protein U1E27_09210 [Kiritimatiellia bacterium]|nr:hypothetical protein [Kiritimatiellia bacterium]